MSDGIVIVYERVSTDQQDISRQAVQRERARVDFPSAELRVVQDDGVSAYKVPIFQRPGGRTLCDLIATGNVEAVYVDAQDRLSRGADDEWVAFRALCDGNDTWIVVDGQRITRDMGGRVLSYLRAELARQESEEKSHRVKSGMARAARQGRANGGPRRFGFDQRAGVLTPRPAEVAVAERILREVLAGRSQTQIALGLNEDGHRTAQGKRWNQVQISQLIRDPVWIGVIRNREGDFPMYEPFLPADLWRAVQEMLREPQGARTGRPTKRFLLANGLLRCGQCGYTMRVKRERKGYGWYEVYICSGRSDGYAPCTQSVVQRAAVDSAVLDYFERVGLDLDATRAELTARADRDRAEVGMLRGQAERELAKVQAGLEKVERDYTLGDLPVADYTRLRARLEGELSASTEAVQRMAVREVEVAEASAVLDDAEVLTRLTELRAAIAGNVTANPDDFAATHAALRRLFKMFHLRAVPVGLRGRFDAVVAVDGEEEVLLEGVPTVAASEVAYWLEPEPRSGAVVFADGGGVVPVPLGLAPESTTNTDGGCNARAR